MKPAKFSSLSNPTYDQTWGTRPAPRVTADSKGFSSPPNGFRISTHKPGEPISVTAAPKGLTSISKCLRICSCSFVDRKSLIICTYTNVGVGGPCLRLPPVIFQIRQDEKARLIHDVSLCSSVSSVVSSPVATRNLSPAILAVARAPGFRETRCPRPRLLICMHRGNHHD